MEQGNNIKRFGALDIERYHRGELSMQERHALEKAALEDPFLADALEGFGTAGIDISADISVLKNRLSERLVPSQKKRGGLPMIWLRVAAAVVIVAGTSILIARLASNKNDSRGDVAVLTKKEPGNASASDSSYKITESPTLTAPDSSTSNNETALVNENVKSKSSDTHYFFSPTISDDKKELPGSSGAVAENDNERKAFKDRDGEGDRGAPPVAALPPPAESEPMREQLEKSLSDVSAPATASVDKAAGRGRQQETAAMSRQRAVMGNMATANNNNGTIANNFYNVYRGTVMDHNNKGLPFANVTNLQDGVGTYTDARGNFTLLSTDSTLNLQVRALGFNTANVQLRNGNGYTFLNYGNRTERSSETVKDNNLNKVILEEDRATDVQTLLDKPIIADRNNRSDSMRLEEDAEPKDGWRNYTNYVYNNLKVPDEAPRAKNNNGFTGNVEVSFEVNKYGEPVNFKIEKSLCAKCDEEAIRLIKEGPKWKRLKKGRTTVTISF